MHRTVSRAAAVLAVLCSVLQPAARASAQEPAREPGSELTVYLATMGPGDAVWEKFGHNAIWIRDAQTRSTIAYNYGIFDFQQESFVPRLMKGRMLYSMGVDDADNSLAAYSWYNRSVTLQRLNLTPAQRHSLREFLEWNWLPQNRDYLYDYFRDNCSTRVRDALDRVLGGALGDALKGVPTGTTFSSHSLRLTAASPATYTGLMLGLGLPTNRPIDAWEESFIPMELMRHVRTIQVTGPDGRVVPLVAEEVAAFEADREPTAAAAPERLWIYLLIGILCATGLLVLAHAGRTRRFARAAVALTIFFWGVATGFFGLILAMLWLFTDHTAAYPNVNLLHVNPLGLLLAAAAPFAVIGSSSSRVARLAWPVALALAGFSMLGLLLHGFAGLRQMNGPLVALLLPIHIAVLGALYHGRTAIPSPAGDGTAVITAPAAA
ncbi:MAG TPA: DUF4105 domain-containing protein [Longimicrobiales bacterium]|nr:DUF4105 domain-containing protein [Longimicrobiales bacterium]